MLCLRGLARVKSGFSGDDVVAADLTARFCPCPQASLKQLVFRSPLECHQRHQNF
jgi:hypothetical protein